MDARSSGSSNYHDDPNASTQAQTKYNKSPNKTRAGQESSNFIQQEEMDEMDELQMDEDDM